MLIIGIFFGLGCLLGHVRQRNKLFKNISRQASLVVDDSFPLLREFQKFQGVNMVTSPRQASLARCWKAPPTSLRKLNVDVAFILAKHLAAAGGVVRDCSGIMIAGLFSKMLEKSCSLLLGACMVAKEGLLLIKRNG